MSDTGSGYDLAAIRKLLLAAFVAEDLRRFCRDRRLFRPIITRFGPGHGFEDLVDRVIDYCETHLLWDEFLAEVKQDNPRQYARFESKLLVAAVDKPAPSAPAGQGARADRPGAPAPQDAAAYNRRGIAHKAAGDLVAAIADYTRAVELDPKYAKAYYNRGLARKAEGDLAAAIADYTHAIELKPNYAEAYNNRGTARVAEGDLAAAIADYTRAMQIDPSRAISYYNMACAYALMADPAQACTWLDRAIARGPRYRAKARTDPDFDAIRHEPCFKALLAEPTASP